MLPSGHAERFAAEIDGLDALRTAGSFRIPEVRARGAAESLDEHLELMRAIERRDAPAAVRLMTLHLDDVESGLVLKEESRTPVDLRDALG